MRVVYLHQYFNTPNMVGGTRSYEMARRLVAAGHEVHMVTTWRDKTHQRKWFKTVEAGINVYWLPLEYSNHMGFAKRATAFLRFAIKSSLKAASLPADLVFATSTPLTVAIPGIYASWRKRVPMVFEVRDLWPDVPIAMGILANPFLVKLAYALERAAYRFATKIVALAPGMKIDISAKGVDESKIEVIPNGCDFDIFSGFSGISEPVAARKVVKSVLYIGTIGLANGVEFIPRLAKELRDHAEPDLVQFYVIGDGSQRTMVEALARQLGVLENGVQFLGALTKREVAQWVAFADATIMTYDGPEIVFRDSVSNKFFDSIAAGKPVIANFSGFSTTTAAEAGAGFIISRDPSIAAVELVGILRPAGTLEAAGRAAAKLARDRFSRDALASQLEHVLSGVVNESQQR